MLENGEQIRADRKEEKRYMRKILKKLSCILPLASAFIIFFAAASGKIDELIYKFNTYKTTKTTEEETVSYPPGKIRIIDKFEWLFPPEVEEYDPDNIEKFNVYGTTVMESEWKNKCLEKVKEYKENIDLPKDKRGDVYNYDNATEVGKEFELVESKRKVTITNVTFNETIDDGYLVPERLLTDVDKLKSMLDENGKITHLNINWFDGEKKRIKR